jgi:leucyl aminopeptidase
MMEISLEKGPAKSVKDDVLAILLCEGEDPPKEFGGTIGPLKKERFSGKASERYAVTTQGKEQFERLLLVGMGPEKDLDANCLRKGSATVVRYCDGNKLKAATVLKPKTKGIGDMESVQALTEGAVLAGFAFDEFKTKRDDIFHMETLTILGTCSDGEKEGLARGYNLAGAQNYVRKLQEVPANLFGPENGAEHARKLAKDRGFDIKVFRTMDLQSMGMNGILAVCQGSAKEPCLVRLEYNMNKKGLPLFALVGKGVCFDSGGISLKPAKGMEEMKYDKSGALGVMGIMMAAANLDLPVRLIGLMPFVENMPSGTAQRPGDIIKMHNGKTVEVLNTDAEGRLILADALAYAAEQKPKAIIDMATLTGAMLICLGKIGSGYFTDDKRLIAALESASGKCGEKIWRLPMWPEFSEMNKGAYADIRNITNTGEAGSATAACFLKEFVGDVPWVHIDIAGTDCAPDLPPHPYLGKGAAGPCVRLVVLALEELAKKG